MARELADTVILRHANPADAAAIAAIYAPYVRDTAISFETEPPDAAIMATRITAVLGSELPWIVAEDTAGRIVGYAYAGRFHARHAYRYTVEPTVYVDSGAWGSGTGSRLYARLMLILEELGYRQAVALITLPNPASVALHERFGFRHSGTHSEVGRKFGQWIDVGLFQRALGAGAADDPGGEPAALDASDAWQMLG